MIERLAFCIKTFERPRAAQRCVDSILALWPDARIYQADDSRQPVRAKGVREFWKLSHDVGCSAGRNHLIRNTREDFVVQVDDDYIFTEHADVLRLARLLDTHDDLVLAGCKCKHHRANRSGWTKYFADVTLKDGVLTARKPTRRNEEPDGLVWFYADTVSNFWVAKRRLFDCMLWDERLKIGGEHADFFQRLQVANGDNNMSAAYFDTLARPAGGLVPLVPLVNDGKMKVAFVPSMWIDHKKDRPGPYQKFRRRDRTYEALYRSMWGIRKVNRWRYGKA